MTDCVQAVRAVVTLHVALRVGRVQSAYDRYGAPVSAPPPKDRSAETERPETSPSGRESWCDHCGGRLALLVRVEPQTNAGSVTYYACEQCAQVLVLKG